MWIKFKLSFSCKKRERDRPYLAYHSESYNSWYARNRMNNFVFNPRFKGAINEEIWIHWVLNWQSYFGNHGTVTYTLEKWKHKILRHLLSSHCQLFKSLLSPTEHLLEIGTFYFLEYMHTYVAVAHALPCSNDHLITLIGALQTKIRILHHFSSSDQANNF